jgi:hypothetical protein
MKAKWGTIIGIVLACLATQALGGTPAQKCEAAKLKIAGKYNFCRLKAEAKAVKTGDPVDYSKCDDSLALKWGSAETYGGGQCPTNGDLLPRQAELSADADRTAWRLSGAPRFVDNADGTITDNQSGLTWEKKAELGSVNFANPHNADNYYQWSGTCTVNASKLCQPSSAAATLCAASAVGGTTGCDQCSGGDGTCNAARRSGPGRPTSTPPASPATPTGASRPGRSWKASSTSPIPLRRW